MYCIAQPSSSQRPHVLAQLVAMYAPSHGTSPGFEQSVSPHLPLSILPSLWTRSKCGRKRCFQNARRVPRVSTLCGITSKCATFERPWLLKHAEGSTGRDGPAEVGRGRGQGADGPAGAAGLGARAGVRVLVLAKPAAARTQKRRGVKRCTFIRRGGRGTRCMSIAPRASTYQHW